MVLNHDRLVDGIKYQI